MNKQLKKNLKELAKCYNIAKSRWSFQKSYRLSRHKVLACFGISNSMFPDKPISLSEIEILYNYLILLVKEKHQKLISERSLTLETNKIVEQITSPESEEESRDNIIDSIFNPKFSDQETSLLTQKEGCNQVVNAKILFDNIHYRKTRGQLLLAQTGAGKTYILASVIKNLLATNFLDKCLSPWPILYVTKASVVEQTKEVLRDDFNIDLSIVHVINIETLRSELGQIFVAEELEVINGTEYTIYKWKKNIHPRLIIWDECQILAREMSIQSKIAQDTNRIEPRYGNPVYQIFSSATPFSRVCEARVFACSTRIKFQLGIGEVILDDSNWKQFANIIAAPANPIDYNEAAIKRLVDRLEPFIVRVKNVRPKHKALNSVKRIFFESEKEAEEYAKAEEEYYKQKNRIENDNTLTASQVNFSLLAQFTIFAKAAEYIRRSHLAKFAYESWSAGKAPVIACRFKRTITGTYKILVEDYGWNRDNVSIIWGGSTETLSIKKKLAQKIGKNKAFQDALEEADIDIEDILGIDLSNLNEKTQEDYAFEKLHDLLSQNPEEREKEKKRFQKQKSKCCFFTFKSGGVGLSLHHQYNYARKRELVFTPVYSEKELVQALGRCPRITSLTDTSQIMLYYGNTIEDHVAAKVVLKLKNLKQVVKSRESWEDIITGRKVMKQEPLALEESTSEEDNSMMEYKEL